MTVLEVSKRPQAARDIEEYFVYIGEDNFDAAVNFLIAVEDGLAELSRFPYLGKVDDTVHEPMNNRRIWHVRGHLHYLLLYQITNDSIDLIRVIHSSRDLESIRR